MIVMVHVTSYTGKLDTFLTNYTLTYKATTQLTNLETNHKPSSLSIGDKGYVPDPRKPDKMFEEVKVRSRTFI